MAVEGPWNSPDKAREPVSSEEKAIPDGEKVELIQGRKIVLPNGRTVSVFRTKEGGAYMEFTRDETVTPLHLSRDAIGAVLSIWTAITWGECPNEQP